MRKFGFSAMKAFLALSSVGKGAERVDWLRVVALSSSIITVVVIVLYFLQRGH
jgi:ABC-type glycerol-3-phosphate transport system permease component